MPSSIGHVLAGLAVSRLRIARHSSKSPGEDWPYALLAATPDLDVIADIVRRRPIDYHNRRSHSLGAALAAGVATGLMSRAFGGRFLPTMMNGAASYSSHLLLDYFGKEAEDGLPLLWPMSGHHFAARRPLFRTIYTKKGRFFTGLMTRRNLQKVAREIAIIVPLVFLADLLSRGRP